MYHCVIQPHLYLTLSPCTTLSLSRPQLLGGNRCGLSVDGVESIQFRWLWNWVGNEVVCWTRWSKKIGTASSSMFGWVYTIGCSDETQHFVVLLKKESCSLRKKNALWLIIERPCIITLDIKVCPCCGGYLVLRSCEKFTVLHFLDGNSSSVGDVKWPVKASE